MEPSAAREPESTRTLCVSEPEAWLIDEVVRHTAAEDGRSLGRDLLVRVFSVLREFRAAAGRPFPPQVLPLGVTEAECWLIDYYVNAARLQRADQHTVRNARDLLMKVFDLILEFQAERALPDGALPLVADDPIPNTLLRERFEEWQRAQQRRAEGRGESQS